MRIKDSRFLAGLIGSFIFLNFGAPARADYIDPPSRVARLGYTEGAVSFQPSGTDDWVDAPINRPLTTGDKLWADRSSRAELQLDGSVVRISSETSVAFLNLDNHVTQIQLSAGTLVVHVRRLDDDETYEIDTPNLAFSPLRPGVYRLTVDESGNTTMVDVRSGQGEVTGAGSAYTVGANQTEAFSGIESLQAIEQDNYSGSDPFYSWSADRDARDDRSESARYVSPDVVGYEDLDGQGDWTQTPDYGAVWIPRGVEAGWAPYSEGHWAYVAPWGYTWVDDQRWGFAPFHYGRWVSWHGSWGWVPCPPRVQGVAYVRPVYAPALVAWVGAGAGVAWFALGPREVFVPSYPVSRGYVDRINISNTRVNTTVINNVYNTTIINNKTVNVTNINYANRSVPGAVTATTARAFTSAQPVARNFVRFDQRNLAQSRVTVRAPSVVPTKQSVVGPGRMDNVRPPAPIQSRTVVARLTPPPPAASFERRQAALQSNGGKPLTAGQARAIAPPERSAPVRIVPPATPSAAQAAPRPSIAPNANNADRFMHPNKPAAPVPAERHQQDQQRPQQPAQQQAEQQRTQQVEQQRAQQQAQQQKAEQQAQQLQVQQQARQQAEQQRAQQQAQQRDQQQRLAAQQVQQAQQAQARQRQLEAQHEQQVQQLAQQQRAQQQQQQQQLQQEQRQQQQNQQNQKKPKDPTEPRPPRS